MYNYYYTCMYNNLQVQESEDQGSLSSREGFVCREGCVFSLTPRVGVSVGKHGSECSMGMSPV